MQLAEPNFFSLMAGAVLATIGFVGFFALKLRPEKRSELRWHGGIAMSGSSIAIIASAMLLGGSTMIVRVVTDRQIPNSAFAAGAIIYGVALVISAVRDFFTNRKT